jgi:prophage regulatory protein
LETVPVPSKELPPFDRIVREPERAQITGVPAATTSRKRAAAQALPARKAAALKAAREKKSALPRALIDANQKHLVEQGLTAAPPARGEHDRERVYGPCAPPLRLLRLPAVRAKTGLPTSTIYAAMAGGTFPRCVPLGPRVVGWVEGEIDDWIATQIAKRDARVAS